MSGTDRILTLLITITLYPLGFGIAASIMAVPAILLYRVFVFLRDGYWINSLCDLAVDINNRGGNVIDACAPLSTGWIGVDSILNWALRGLDASLLAVTISVTLWLLWHTAIILIGQLGKLFQPDLN